MGFFHRIARWLSKARVPKQIPKTVLLQELVDKARRSQYGENYDEALALLSRAMDIAEAEHDTRTKVDITLSRADILIAHKDYKTARFVLNELIEDSRARQMNAPLAYSLCSMGVLEQAQGNLAAAQELYEQARQTADAIHTDGASGRATAHLGDVYLEQGNASYAAYLLEEAVTKLNRSGDRELLGYFLGQLGLAQIQSGHGEQGEIRLQRGLDLAINIQHHAQMRYLNTLLGEQSLKNANFRRAQSYFYEALKLYPSPAPQTMDYARLLCQLSKASLHIDQIDDARKYAEEALPLAENLSEDSLIAMAKAAIGLAMQANNEAGALGYLRDAVNTYTDIEPDSFYIDMLRNLAAAHIQSGDLDAGIATYEDAIAKAAKMPQEAAQSHNDLANSYAKRRELRKAIEQWQEAIKCFQDANQTGQVARAHCDIAAMYDQLGDGRMAQREYGTALEMLSRMDDSNTRGIILANVAAAYSEYGDVESAQDFFKEAIDIAQRNRNPAAEALRRGNYGRLLALTNRPKQALTQLNPAQRKSEELGLELQAAIMLNNIGLAYALMHDVAPAIERYQRALSQLSSLEAPQWQARVHVNWGDTALASADSAVAGEHYESAYQLAQENALVDVLIQALIGQAQVAIHNNDLGRAESKLSEVDSIAKRLNYRRLLALLHQTKSQLYAKHGKADEAASEWEEAKKHRSIMRMEPIAPDWL